MSDLSDAVLADRKEEQAKYHVHNAAYQGIIRELRKHGYSVSQAERGWNWTHNISWPGDRGTGHTRWALAKIEDTWIELRGRGFSHVVELEDPQSIEKAIDFCGHVFQM